MRLAAIALVLATAGCSAGTSAFREGQRAADGGRWGEAVALYERALGEEPDNIEFRMALLRARFEAARVHIDEARRLEAAGAPRRAEAELEMALELDPGNRFARDWLDELRSTPRVPVLSIAALPDTPISLEFRDTSLQEILETLAELAGVNILFDEAFRDRSVSVDLRGVTLREAFELLTSIHGLYYKLEPSAAGTVRARE